MNLRRLHFRGADHIWQCCHNGGSPTDIDVLSFGSDSPSRLCKAELGEVASRYEKVIVWTDKPEMAIELLGSLAGGRCSAMRSPLGMDANDVLRRYGGDGLRKLIEARFARILRH